MEIQLKSGITVPMIGHSSSITVSPDQVAIRQNMRMVSAAMMGFMTANTS
jgi:hypothetical protein